MARADRGPSACAQSIRCNILSDKALLDGRFERETQNQDCVVDLQSMRLQPGLEVQIRRAGCGVFFSITDDRSCSAPSPCLDVRRLTTVYVVRIATSRIRGETQKCDEENTDLWNEFGDRAETQ